MADEEEPGSEDERDRFVGELWKTLSALLRLLIGKHVISEQEWTEALRQTEASMREIDEIGEAAIKMGVDVEEVLSLEWQRKVLAVLEEIRRKKES